MKSVPLVVRKRAMGKKIAPGWRGAGSTGVPDGVIG